MKSRITFEEKEPVWNNPGETTTFHIKITNKGNSIENFTADLQDGYIKPDGIKSSTYYPSDAVIILNPDEIVQSGFRDIAAGYCGDKVAAGGRDHDAVRERASVSGWYAQLQQQ